jgi:hypothetical protein
MPRKAISQEIFNLIKHKLEASGASIDVARDVV